MRKLAEWITDPDPNVFLSDRYVVLDLETTNTDHGDARTESNRIVYGNVVLSPSLHTQLASDRKDVKQSYDVYSTLDLLELSEYFYEADFFVAHNASFELKWMQRSGIDTRRVLPYCTQIGEYVIGGNRTGEHYWPVGLNASLERYGLPAKDSSIEEQIHAGICPSTLPPGGVRRYCKIDVDITEQLMLRQRQLLFNAELLPVFLLRCMFAPVVADMEIKGMCIDPEQARLADRALVKHMEQLKDQLQKAAGGLNLNSAPQKQWFMYGDHPKGLHLPYPKDQMGRERVGKPNKYFPDGAPKADKEAIQWLTSQKLRKRQKRWITDVASYTKAYTNWSRYTRKFVELASGSTTGPALLFGGLHQTVTKTHRLASSPNLQNISRNLKKIFCARNPGWMIGQADYDGMEFRIAGELADDAQVADDIANDRDPHSFSAHVIFDAPWPYNIKTEGTPEEKELRNQAKPDTFKPLYGGSSGTPKQQAYYQAFRDRYPGIADMQQWWLNECIDHGKFRVITGLILYFPNTERKSDGYVTNTGKIFNIPVQQFATADCGPLGATILWHHLWADNMETFLVNYVHDSIVAEVHPDERDQFEDLCHQCMTTKMVDAMDAIINHRIRLPITVEVKVQDHWGANLNKQENNG